MNTLSHCRILQNSLRPVRSLRNFSSSRLLRELKTPAESASGPKSTNKNDGTIGSFHHKVSDFDKWVLLWTKKYPSKEEVPKYVADDIMQSAMSKARIRVCNIMMVFVIGICIYTVVTGKKNKKEQLSHVENTHDDFRRQMTEEFRQKLAEDKSK